MPESTVRPNQITWSRMTKERGPDEEADLQQCKSISISRKTAQRADPERGGYTMICLLLFKNKKKPHCSHVAQSKDCSGKN